MTSRLERRGRSWCTDSRRGVQMAQVLGDKMDEPFSRGKCQTLTMSGWSEEGLFFFCSTSLSPPSLWMFRARIRQFSQDNDFCSTWPVSRHFRIFPPRQKSINTRGAAREINKTALLTEEISKQRYWLLLCLNCNRKHFFYFFYFSSFLRGKGVSGIFPKQSALLLNPRAANHNALASHFLPSSI